MNTHWDISDVFVVRHAGFPFDMVESLGFSLSLLDLLDQVCDIEERLIQLAEVAGEQKLVRVKEALRRGQEPPTPKHHTGEWDEALSTWRSLRRHLREEYEKEYLHLRKCLHSLAATPAFQEAIFFSNPFFYENVLQSFLAKEVGSASSNSRRVERQIYKYLQRFCAKNETTSFFGPIAYGEVNDSATFKLCKNEPEKRHVTIAYWALRELNRQICRASSLRLHIPVRRNPLFSFDSAYAISSVQGITIPLTSPIDQLIAILDQQEMSFAQAAHILDTSPSSLFTASLPLLRCGALILEIPLPPDDADGLTTLIAGLQRVPEGEARNQWLAHLRQLDELRESFAQANLEERRQILDKLEGLFTEWTGKPARRRAGKMYADRLLLNEEASSRFSIHMGRHIAENIAQRLSPALELSASYGSSVQDMYRRQVQDLFPANGSSLSFLDYAHHARPDGELHSGTASLPTLSVQGNTTIDLQLPSDFAGPSVEGGRYALPDICLAASSPQAIADGQMDIVLSRVHHHLMIWGWLARFFPSRQRYEKTATTWLECEPSAHGLVSLEVERRNKGFYSFPGTRLAMGAIARTEGQEMISPASLTISLHPSGPVLRDAQGKQLQLYLPLADFVFYPPFAALAHPPVLHAPCAGDASGTPRLRVGDTIYQRRRWHADLSSLTSLHTIDLALEIWRLRRTHQWPRFVFARVASERKPWLFDTASPFSHELVKNMIRDDAMVTLEEMLPGPDQLWLQDDEGQRYTSELRLQVHRYSAEIIRLDESQNSGKGHNKTSYSTL